MPPVLLSRRLDPFLGIFTGFLAYYLYETHPRTAVPQDQRLAELLRWKLTKFQDRRTERLNAMETDFPVLPPVENLK